jgi:hypothetical protein
MIEMTSRLMRLRKSLLAMSPEELSMLVARIREDRHLTKERPSMKRQAARSKDKTRLDARSILSVLSPEELEALNGEFGDASTGGASI